jgi:cobalt/nickel transport system ATP-binding protein
LILDEDHRLVADGPGNEILRDQELLLKANLIHEHYHHHNGVVHRHLTAMSSATDMSIELFSIK